MGIPLEGYSVVCWGFNFVLLVNLSDVRSEWLTCWMMGDGFGFNLRVWFWLYMFPRHDCRLSAFEESDVWWRSWQQLQAAINGGANFPGISPEIR